MVSATGPNSCPPAPAASAAAKTIMMMAIACGHGRGHLLGGAVELVQARCASSADRASMFSTTTGGVHQHANGNRQPAQRHQVGRQPPLAHQHKVASADGGRISATTRAARRLPKERQQQHQHQCNRLGQDLGDRATARSTRAPRS